MSKTMKFKSRGNLTTVRHGITRAAGIALTALAAASAQAGLLIEMPQPLPDAAPQGGAFEKSSVQQIRRARKPMDLTSRLTANITQKGVPPLELPPVRGQGIDVTLSDALKQIIPGGWKVFTEDDLPEDMLVSWQGNRNWPMALNTVLMPAGIKADIDWDAAEITLVGKQSAPKTSPVAAPVVAQRPAAPAVNVGAASPASYAQPVASPVATLAQASPAPAATATPSVPAPVLPAAAPAPSPAAPVAAAPAAASTVSQPGATNVTVINKIDEERIARIVADTLAKRSQAGTDAVSPAQATQAAAKQAAQAPAPAPAALAALAAPAAPATPAAPSVPATSPSTATPKATALAIAEAPAPVKAPAVKTWRLNRDMFLRENIRAWAEQEGWTLQWDAVVGDRIVNYPINADASLQGELVGQGGVIDRVIAKYVKADEPLGVRFYRGNKVVVVYLYSATPAAFKTSPNQ